MITQEEDRRLRQYAKYLHMECGEDAYHIVVCDLLSKDKMCEIKDTISFFHVAIRRALYKIFRHERVEKDNIQAFINNDPTPTQIAFKNLEKGREKLPTCRRGHEWKTETIIYVGKQRTCKICKYEQDRISAKLRRQNMRLIR